MGDAFASQAAGRLDHSLIFAFGEHYLARVLARPLDQRLDH